MSNYEKSFHHKFHTVEQFIVSVRTYIKEVDDKQYHGGIGRVLMSYAQADNEEMKEHPNWTKRQELINEAFEIIQSLNELYTLDEIRKSMKLKHI